MPAENKKDIQLEIAHVLFIDIVRYSKLSINDQQAAVEELKQIVRASEQFQRAEAASRLLKIPTGDGMAVVFYTSPEAPAQCALEISRALKKHPRLQLRMGIHSNVDRSYDIKVSSTEVEENKYQPDLALTVLAEIQKNS
jgi:class 3 adenylate cyclase